MSATAAKQAKRPTPTEDLPTEPPHWEAERIEGRRSGADLLLVLARTDRHKAELQPVAQWKALVAEVAEQVREAYSSFESVARVEAIRDELATLGTQIMHATDEAQKAHYQRGRFDAAASEDPGEELARLEATHRGLSAKVEALGEKRRKLLLDLERAVAAIDIELGDQIRTAISQRLRDHERRRSAALRELLKRGEALFDELARADAGRLALASEDFTRDVLAKLK